MLKRSSRALVAIAAALVMASAGGGAALADPPEKTTGDATFTVGSTWLTLEISASDAGGHVAYANSNNLWFTGTVDCYMQAENVSGIGGVITDADGWSTGQRFFVEVADNGNGGSGDPDTARVLAGSAEGCAITGTRPATRSDGNITVH